MAALALLWVLVTAAPATSAGPAAPPSPPIPSQSAVPPTAVGTPPGTTSTSTATATPTPTAPPPTEAPTAPPTPFVEPIVAGATAAGLPAEHSSIAITPTPTSDGSSLSEYAILAMVVLGVIAGASFFLFFRLR